MQKQFTPPFLVRTFFFALLTLMSQLGISQEDLCTDATANAILIDCSTGTTFDMGSGATGPDAELAGSCLDGMDVSWYAYTFDIGVITFDFTGTGDYVLFEAADCASISAGSEIASSCAGDVTDYTIIHSQVYYVALLNGDSFEFTTSTAPSNEDCGSPETLAENSTETNQTNVCASAPSGGCGGDHSVWYEVDIAADGTTLEIVISGGSIANVEVSIYDNCGGTDVSNAGCIDNPIADCLAAGIYLVEVSSATADAGTFDIEAISTPTGPPEDICDNALDPIGALVVCGDLATLSGTGTACPDAIASGCMSGVEGVWYTFQTDPSLPNFTLTGVFELFEGADCTSLNPIDNCNVSGVAITADPSFTYWVLIDDNGSVDMTTPAAPANITCGDALGTSGGTYSNCCAAGGEVWFEMSPDFDGGGFSFTNNTIPGSFTVEIFEGPCGSGNLLYDDTGDFMDVILPNCGESKFMKITSTDCGEFTIAVTNESCQYGPYAPDCGSSEPIPQPTTGSGPSCVDGCTTFVCENDCGGTSGSWFQVFTDVDASLMNITINAGSSFSPVLQVLQADCDPSAPQALLLDCSATSDVSFAVNANVTYFINVSNAAGGEPGEFEICIETNVLAAQCADGVLVASRPENPFADPDGPYCSGEKVQFDYTVTHTADPLGQGNNCQWLQGLIPSLGPGWDLSACSIESQTPGGFDWFPEGIVQSQVNSALLGLQPSPHGGNELVFGPGGLGIGDDIPQGWYSTSNGGAGCSNDGTPNTMWGIQQGCGSTVAYNYTFFFQVRDDYTPQECLDPDFLKVHIFSMADGMTGCWVNNACSEDAPAIENYEVNCTGLINICAVLEHEVCSGDTDFEIELQTCGGEDAEIIVEINEDSSSDVDGVNEHNFDSGIGAIDDDLVNEGCSVEVVIYNAYAIDPVSGCQGPITEIEVLVYPEVQIEFDLDDRQFICPGEDYELNVMGVCPTRGPYTYEWQTGSEDQSISLPHEPNLPAGNYGVNVTVTDVDGCTAEMEFEYETTQQLFPDIVGPASMCKGDGVSNNKFVVRHEDNSQNNDYDWFVIPAIGLDFNTLDGDSCIIVNDENSTVGDYNMTVEIVDELDCIYDTTFVISIGNGPTLSLVAGDCTGDQIKLVGKNSNPVVMATDMHIVQYDPTVTPVVVDTLIGLLQTDSLCVTITDFTGVFELRGASLQGCETSSAPLVLPPKPTPDILVTTPTLCAGDNVGISISNAGDFASFTWSGGGQTWTTADVPDAPLVTTTYTFTGIDFNGCEINESNMVTVSPLPNLEITGSSTVCNGGESVLTANATQGVAPYTYTWDDQTTDQTLAVSPAALTTYSVTVQDDFGCTATATFSVEPSTSIVPNASAPPFCEGGMTTIDAGADYASYLWEDPSDSPIGGGARAFSTDVPGDYKLTVTDATGCSGTAIVTVTEVAALPVAITETSATLCNETSVTAETFIDLTALVQNGVGGFWQDEQGNNVVNPSNVSFLNQIPDTYTYTYVTTAAVEPCMDTSYPFDIIIQDCGCPSVAVGTIADYCAEDGNGAFDLTQIQLSTEPGSWSITPSDIDIAGDMFSVDSATPTGMYELLYTLDTAPAAPCEAASTPVPFTVWAPLVASLDPTGSACNSDATGDPTFLDLNTLVTGDMTGTWTSTDGLPINGSVVDFENLALGGYEFVYFVPKPVGSACDDLRLEVDVRVIDCNCPDVSISPLDPLCSSGGGINFNDYLNNPLNEPGSWSIDDPTAAAALTGDRFESENIPAGTYNVSFVLANPINGCDDVNVVFQTLLISDPPAAEILYNADIDVCNGDNITPFPFLVDLDTLVQGSPGEWTAPAGFPGTFDPAENIVDFTDVATAFYTFTFTTTDAVAPCDNLDLELRVDVRNCNCEMFEFIIPDPICNLEGDIDLAQYITNIGTLSSGAWAFITGPSLGTVNGSITNVETYVTGEYVFQYELDDVPLQCPKFHNVTLNITEQPVPDVEPFVTACNTVRQDGDHCIDLTTIATGVPGDWIFDTAYTGSTSDLTMICFDGLNEGDQFVFVYEIDNSAIPCDNTMHPVTITVADCACPIVTVDPGPHDLCSGASFDLSSIESPSIADGEWELFDPAGAGGLTDSNFNSDGLDIGIYTFRYFSDLMPDPNCTNQYGETMVEIFAPTSAGFNAEEAVCGGETALVDLNALLSADADQGGSWSEAGTNPQAGGFDDVAGTFDPSGLRDGTYEFMYTVPNNGPCDGDEAIITVEIAMLPTADAGLDQTISCAERAQLGGIGTTIGQGVTYMWTADNGATLDNPTEQRIESSIPGTYTLVVTDANGCTHADEVVITSDGGLAVEVDPEDADCFGEPGLLLVTQLSGGSDVQYLLDGEVLDLSQGNLVEVSPGTYTLLVKDENGCEITETFTIAQPAELTVDAGDPRQIELGGLDTLFAAISIDAADIASIEWIDQESGEILCSGLNCTSLEVDPDIFNTYCVTVIDINGCEEMACVTVREKLEQDVYIPNVFNPSEDDENNRTFHVHSDSFLESVNFLNIYDRWGELVYAAPANHQPNIPEFGWNGRWNNIGNNVEPGVYVYVIEVQYVDTGNGAETEIFAGDITVYR